MPARQGSEPANKVSYMDVSDRSLQAMLTQEAKITSACSLSEVIFAFGDFGNAGNALIAPRSGLCRVKTGPSTGGDGRKLPRRGSSISSPPALRRRAVVLVLRAAQRLLLHAEKRLRHVPVGLRRRAAQRPGKQQRQQHRRDDRDPDRPRLPPRFFLYCAARRAIMRLPGLTTSAKKRIMDGRPGPRAGRRIPVRP